MAPFPGYRDDVNKDMSENVRVVRTSLDPLPYGDYRADALPDKKTKFDFPEGVTRGMMLRDVMIIAWPSLVELILTQLTSMADQVMVGRMVGEAGVMGLSAVGLATQPKFLLMTMIQAMNVGSTALIARFRGQQNREKANQVFRQAILLNLLMSFLFMGLGLVFSKSLIRLMAGQGISDGTFQQAVEYLNINLYGFVPLLMSFTITASLRGIGDSRTPLIYNTIANVVNLILNYLLIYGKLGFPEMGIRGAALATVIGQTVAFCIALTKIFGERNYLRLNFREKFTFDAELMMGVVRIGFPSMIEQLFMRAGMIIYNRTVTDLGDLMYATHMVCMSIQALSFMMSQAFANSTTTLMGQSLGKRRYDMAVLYMKQARLIGGAVSMAVGALVIIFSKQIVGLYNSTPAVIEMGAKILIIIAISLPIQSSQFIISGGLRGAGDTRFAAVVTAITVFGIRSILSILLIRVLHLGLWGAWIALLSDQMIRTGFFIYRYSTGKWAQMALAEAMDAGSEDELISDFES